MAESGRRDNGGEPGRPQRRSGGRQGHGGGPRSGGGRPQRSSGGQRNDGDRRTPRERDRFGSRDDRKGREDRREQDDRGRGRPARREDDRSRDRGGFRDDRRDSRNDQRGGGRSRPRDNDRSDGRRDDRSPDRRGDRDREPGARGDRTNDRRDASNRGDRRPERHERYDRRDSRHRDDRRPDRQNHRNKQDQPPERRDRPVRDRRPQRAEQVAPRPQDDETTARDLLAAPELPEDVEFTELDEEARRELRSLPKDLAERIGRHLVAAGHLIDTDPEAALEHARYAKAKASRVPIVREAVGLAAYHAGNWSEALSELRAVRRMTRTDSHVAVIADAERALGRPERALDLAKEVDPARLPRAVAVELRIVAAGARRDLGQLDAAVVGLQIPDLDPNRQDPWSARLFYAYADNLAAAGRTEEALRWFLHAADADVEEETDAADRAAELGDG